MIQLTKNVTGGGKTFSKGSVFTEYRGQQLNEDGTFTIKSGWCSYITIQPDCFISGSEAREIALREIEEEKKLKEPWKRFKDEKPPHKVVIGACYTYDCGWTQDTVWWYEDKQCWMTTGAVESTEAHLPYTHWRKLPPFPNEV